MVASAQLNRRAAQGNDGLGAGRAVPNARLSDREGSSAAVAVEGRMTAPTVLARLDQFPSMKSSIISRTASTICTPLAVLQPAARAACNSGVTPCPAITSPTNIEGVSK